jgi:hypothetical protein
MSRGVPPIAFDETPARHTPAVDPFSLQWRAHSGACLSRGRAALS